MSTSFSSGQNSSSLSNTRTVWAVNSYSWLEADRLTKELGVPLVVGMVLAGRGLSDPTEARSFLDCAYSLPDPFLFAHMEAAVGAVSRAMQHKRRIVIHGDYDADGITATALTVLGLRDLGLEAEWYLPSRFKEGYGLSRHAVESIAHGGPGVLITVDCGVNYASEVALARDMGLEVIVIDHHRPGPVLPECHLIHQAVGDYPHGDLCGVGLALKFLHALHVRLFGASRDALPEGLHKLLDLVAVGTIADLAPLQGENRYYVKEGLKLIAIGQRLGMRALCSVAGCTGAVDSGTVAYRLAPRLNAAGRLADPSLPLRLLLTDDEGEAKELAVMLHDLNGVRQDVERQILNEAVERVEALEELPPVLVLAGDNWHEGVVGIVAARLVERYHHPAIVLGVREGVAKGSGRSIPAYDLMSGLNACADYLTVYGGHKQAAGLTLHASHLDEFTQALCAHAGMLLDEHDFTPVYRADAVLRGEDINADTATALASLGPFGTGNPKPRLLLAGARVEQAEATRNGAHLRCMIDVDGVKVRGIGFGMGDMATALQESADPWLIGAQLRVDEWQGTVRPEFLLERLDWGGGSLPALTLPAAALASRPSEQAGRGSDCDLDARRPRPHSWPTRARDLRGAPGAASAVAQVLVSGERTMLVACSIGHALESLGEKVRLDALCGSELGYAARGAALAVCREVGEARVAAVDWDTAVSVFEAGEPWAHVVALGPPFRASHVDFLCRAQAAGACVHLCYGDAERQATVRLLRYLIHPRYAMVCLYQAMRETEGLDAASARDVLFKRAAEIGHNEAGVVLTWSDLSRAWSILNELGIQRFVAGQAKLEPRSVSTYVVAEADYEECSRLCLTY